MFLTLFVVSFVAQSCLTSDKSKKFIDPVVSSHKKVVSACSRSGGLIFILYSDGSSQTKYPNGHCVDHPPMLK